MLQTRPDAVKTLAHDKIHTFPFKEVPGCWIRLYEDACIWTVVNILASHAGSTEEDGQRMRSSLKRDSDGVAKAYQRPDLRMLSSDDSDSWLAEVVRELDMAIIMTEAEVRGGLIHDIFDRLEAFLEHQENAAWPFSRLFPHDRNALELENTVPVKASLSLEAFQIHLDSNGGPMVIQDVVTDWPAYELWYNPEYLYRKTLRGHRLVPVEVGKSYTHDAWTQKIMAFKDFMTKHLLNPKANEVGYLAQHNLLKQVPALIGDTITPDFCHCEPPNDLPDNIPERPRKLPIPETNVWLGPGGTISDLHTDPYHNILCQVIGRKYIRLYDPEETHRLYPRGTDEAGINMNNTSEVDIKQARKLFTTGSSSTDNSDQADVVAEIADFEKRFPLFKEAKYLECILEAGDCLYIPIGWWHFVESLETSINVSYWFN
ncbi:hypothetical protein KVT40_000260 [Elsinoe batatas]|uniref:JmjC domain-containing protein n=1 Tax=Elsinoe batatas TaxID=2601811 RepID=A0A8K0LBQ9_9PEZI|nr:hypothetical protein KVT40_000260 [Elsinoe batatas]